MSTQETRYFEKGVYLALIKRAMKAESAATRNILIGVSVGAGVAVVAAFVTAAAVVHNVATKEPGSQFLFKLILVF